MPTTTPAACRSASGAEPVGYMIEGDGRSVYFAGDTDVFARWRGGGAGRRRAAPDLGLGAALGARAHGPRARGPGAVALRRAADRGADPLGHLLSDPPRAAGEPPPSWTRLPRCSSGRRSNRPLEPRWARAEARRGDADVAGPRSLMAPAGPWSGREMPRRPRERRCGTCRVAETVVEPGAAKRLLRRGPSRGRARTRLLAHRAGRGGRRASRLRSCRGG